MSEASSSVKFDASALSALKVEVAEVLGAQLAGQLNRLPLERFCSRGGWPLEVALGRVELVYEDAAKLEALLYVSFTETGAACCSGDVFEHQHFEELLLRVDKADGVGSFPVAG